VHSQALKTSKMTKTLSVDAKMINFALIELAKLIVRLNKNSKKTRKDQNLIKKIEKIRDTIQDAVVYAKLKKSVGQKVIGI
jgi:3-methyladenine DNA glycosylase Tag